jgi:predicted phage-related endonuclease
MSISGLHDRRTFIGGSDARIIMGDDEEALVRLWREKRGEVESEDLSGNLIVQLGLATEELNRRWYEANTGHLIADVRRQVRHPMVRWTGATLDARVEATGAVFEAKFMLPWSFSEEAAIGKHMAQLQHNMWVVASRTAVLSVITGGGKWVEIPTHAGPLYQHLILTAERKFWRCVESGEPPRLSGVEPPIQPVRIVDMSGSHAWAGFAGSRAEGYFFLACRRFRSRRPSPPPFSSMKSIPARSKAARIASTAPRETSRRSFSKSTTVESPRPAACASCDWVIPSSPRAARHWAGVILSTFFVDRPHKVSYQQFLLMTRFAGTMKPTRSERSMSAQRRSITNSTHRRCFIGGSDARIIMGDDETALFRLWREKRGEVEPEDLSANLIVQLGLATEELNRRWYEVNTGQAIADVQRQIRHPTLQWMGATLDGRVEATGAVFEAKFMLPWSFSEEAAAEKHMAQLQHNMWVVASREAVLSVITGGGKWVEITTHADPLYQHLIVTAERKFWRCVESGEPPRLFGVEPPKPRIQAVRIVDMSGSNAWAEFASVFARTRAAHVEHEQAKTELKTLMPEDAKEAIGHGVRAKRSKSGAVSFDLLVQEGSHAAVE